jgi:outer membrane protein OmpA-like peptidoglycan-associated protein
MGVSNGPSALTVIPGQGVNLAATGFVPGSTVGLYAIPSGVSVGTMPVTSSGAVSGAAVVDSYAAAGMTALQMAGQTSAGVVNVTIAVSTAPPAVPARTNAGALPEVPVGSSVVLVDGVPQVNTPRRTETAINVVEGESALTLTAEDSTGQTRPLRSNGEMTIQEQGLIALQGTGYRDYVDVFLFSEPVFVGRILVNSDGTFQGSLPVPVELADGQHTLQSVGRGVGGETVAISVSVRKIGDTSSESNGTIARKAVAFHKDSVRLDAKDRQRLRALVKSISNDSASITVMGTYLKDRKTNRDVNMAKQRAMAVRKYLTTLGFDGSIDVGVRARKKSVAPTTPNRYVVVTVRSM